MFGTMERVSDQDLATHARELAEVLNRLPLPPPSFDTPNPLGLHPPVIGNQDGRRGQR